MQTNPFQTISVTCYVLKGWQNRYAIVFTNRKQKKADIANPERNWPNDLLQFSWIRLLYCLHKQTVNLRTSCVWSKFWSSSKPSSFHAVDFHISLEATTQKVDLPNSTGTIVCTSIFEWCVVRCGSKKRHQKDMCLKGLDYMLRKY